MLPAAALGAALVWLAENAGWLGGAAPLIYTIFPIVFAGVTLQPLRGESLKDEMRLAKRSAAGRSAAGASERSH